MQSGTQLHLALLRKISHQTPTQNYREKIAHSRRRKEFFRCNLTQQSNPQSALPLFELSSNQAATSKSKSRKKYNKKLFNEENITISAWSIDQNDHKEDKEQQRYNKKIKQEKLEQNSTKKRRNFSFNNHFSIKKTLPQIQRNRSPQIEFQHRKQRIQKQIAPRSRFSKIRHININLNKQNDLFAFDQPFTKEAKILSTQKITSFDAFVNEIKQQQRNKKFRN